MVCEALIGFGTVRRWTGLLCCTVAASSSDDDSLSESDDVSELDVSVKIKFGCLLFNKVDNFREISVIEMKATRITI